MDQLQSELQNLQIDLLSLIPQALVKLFQEGRISENDPVDAVALKYSTVGNWSVFTTVGVRTVKQRRALEAHFPDSVAGQLNPAEFLVFKDLADIIDVPPTYVETCEKLTELVIRAEEARPDDIEDFTEYELLEAMMRRVTLQLTQRWHEPSVPSADPLMFYALDFYQDDLVDAVSRSVDPNVLERAGYQPLPRSCPECEASFIAKVDSPMDSAPCPDCGANT